MFIKLTLHSVAIPVRFVANDRDNISLHGKSNISVKICL